MSAPGSPPVILTPRGSLSVSKAGRAELSWNVTFRPKWWKRYSNAQMFVDREIIRLSEPFTPMRTGVMIASATLGTEIGSGLVKWIAVYSRWQYYSPRPVGSETGPLRGPFWFERMKANYGRRIIAAAKRIAGGGT